MSTPNNDDGIFLSITYGEPTPYKIGDDRIVIGHEREGLRVALTTGEGHWPVRYLVDGGGQPIIFQSEVEALAAAERSVKKVQEISHV